MKIEKIEIYGFGKWHNVVFDVKDHFQVFYGLNEAGKSTLRQFIYSILFGFAGGRGSNKYLQYLPKKAKGSAGYGGTLTVNHNQQTYQIERIKGKNGGKVTIKDVSQGTVMPTEFLSELLGPVDQNTYERLFGFNQSDLDNFDDLGNRDDLRRHILRMGAVGSEEWIKLENDLSKSADKIYTSKSRVRDLNKKISEYQNALQQLAIDKERLPDYQSAQATKGQYEKELKETRNQIVTMEQHQAKLKQLQEVWPHFVEYQALKNKLAEIPSDYLRLDLEPIKGLIEKQETKTQSIKQNQQELANIVIDSNLSDNEALTKLQSELPDVKFKYQQAEDLASQIKQNVDQVESINQDLGGVDADLDPMDSEDFNKVKQLQNEKQTKLSELNQLLANQTPEAKANNGNVTIGAVVILMALVLFLPLAMIYKIMLCIVIGGGGYFWISKQNQQTSSSSSDEQANLIRQALEEIEIQIQAIGKNNHFSDFSISDWDDIQTKLVHRQKLTENIAILKSQASESSQSINHFWNQSNPLIQAATAHDLAALMQLSEQVNQQIKQNNSQQALIQKRELLQQNLNQDKAELNQIKNRLQAYAIEGLNEHPHDWLDEIKHAQNEQHRLQDLVKMLNEDMLVKLNQYSDLDMLDREIDQIMVKLNDLRQKEQQVLDKRSDQIGEMTGLKNSIDLRKEQQLISEKEAEMQDLITEWLTLQMGVSWVDQTLGVATKGRLPLIMKQANQYLQTITDNRYQNVEFNQHDQVEITDQNGDHFELGELSKGTLEQLYIAIRLAFMQSFADTVDLPIIIDDAFVAFDDVRLQQVFGLMEKISQQTQIIYFSAKKEVYQLTDTGNITNLNDK